MRFAMNFFRDVSLNEKLGALAVCLVFTPLGISQNIVSVRAGFIHHTEGAVFLQDKAFQKDPSSQYTSKRARNCAPKMAESK